MDFNEYRNDLDKNLKEALEDLMEEGKDKKKRVTNAENKRDIDQIYNCLFLVSMIVQKLAIYQMKNSLAGGRDSAQLTDLSMMIKNLNEMMDDVFPDFIDLEEDDDAKD